MYMCAAKQYIEEILSVYNKVKSEYNNLVSQLRIYDLAIQDIIHFIELSNSFSASAGYNYAKRLKEITTERRKIKDELEVLQALFNSLQNRNLHKIKRNIDSKLLAQNKRNYTPRVLDEKLNIRGKDINITDSSI